jgi:regulator of sigma E protease
VQTVLAFIFAIGVLITLHELGHYSVARFFGVRVLRFSIGFGKPLLKWQRGPDSTEWVLAAIPLGGYVKMLDEREGAVPPEQLHLAFTRKPLAQRAAIVAAGPLVNLLVAVVLYAAVSVVGTPEISPLLGEPPEATAAARAGVRDGDVAQALIVGSSEREVASLQQLRWQLVRAAASGDSVVLVVNRRGSLRELPLEVSAGNATFDDVWFRQLGIRLPDTPAVLGEVMPSGAAASAGLLTGDEVKRVNGKEINSAAELRLLVRMSAGQRLETEVLRGGAKLNLTLTPRRVKDPSGAEIGRIEAAVGIPPATVLVQRSVVDALSYGVEQTWAMSTLTLRMIGKMLIGQASIKQVSGPLTIADYAGKSAAFGLLAYLLFMAAVSVSLGVLNLVPIPLLDGGHLLYYAAEALLGRPVPPVWEAAGQRIGIFALFALMAVALFNDFSRYVLQ